MGHERLKTRPDMARLEAAVRQDYLEGRRNAAER